MLIALITFLLSMLGNSETLEDRIVASLADAGRLAQAVEVVGRLQALEADVQQRLAAASDAWREVHARHDATREDYLGASLELERAFERTARELVAARTQLTQILTEEEWRAVFPAAADG